MKKQIIGIALASSIIISGGLTKTVYADSVPVESTQEMQQYINKLDFLYVIEKSEYDKMIEKNVALFSIKDHLLVIDSENITEEEEGKLRNSKEFFIVGDNDGKLGELKKRDNYAAEFLGKNKSIDSVKYAIKNSKGKDIVISNSSSLADSLTALQISKLENKALIVIDDKLSTKVKKYIKENSKNKAISFVEGEKTVNEKIKKQIMKLAQNDSYELNKEQFIKSGLIPTQKDENKEEIPTENVEITGENEINTDTLLNGFMSKTIKKAADKSAKVSKATFTGKEKTISLEIDSEKDAKSISEIIKSDAVEVVKDDEKKTREILKSKEKEGFSVGQISITNSKPVKKSELLKLKKEKKNYYIVPKKVDDELIKKVNDGKYGDGPERKEFLSLDGYDYKEVQAELKRIEDEKKAKIEKQKREQEERERKQEERERALERQRTQAYADNNSGVINNYGGPARSKNGLESSETGPIDRGSHDTGSENLDKFLDSLTSMEGWTYSQPRRMSYGYADCSSIIIRAMFDAGITKNYSNMTTRSIFNDSRFYEIPFDEAKKGDILWTPGHVEVYMGENTTFGAFRPGIDAGYSTGKNRFQRALRISGI